MSRAQQQPYALQLRKQYVDGRNLNARFELHRRFSTNPYGWTRWVFDQMALPSGARVLELGCGTGLLWKTNLTRVSPTWRMTLSDFSFGMLREARANLDRASLQISFARLDAEALPFGDGSFDAVIANHMLYHVEDRDRVISQVGRVLAPGGTFYAATNGLAHLRELDRIVERFMAGRSPLEDNAERFGLETGGTQLRRHFGAVELRRYNDSLVVTEAQPLVDYVASSMGGQTEETLAAMYHYVEEQLHQHGSIQIAKDAGVFISRDSERVGRSCSLSSCRPGKRGSKPDWQCRVPNRILNPWQIFNPCHHDGRGRQSFRAEGKPYACCSTQVLNRTFSGLARAPVAMTICWACE